MTQVVTPQQPFVLRDFRLGRYTNVGNFIVPENSVSNSINVNFDDIIGVARVRRGTTKLGATVASNKTPLGLGSFVGKNGTPNLLLAVYSGASTATIYYYDTAWHASATTNLSNSAINRFSVLGNHGFITNSVDGMKDSADGNTWATTNSIGTYKPSCLFRYAGRMLAAGDPTYPDRVFFSSVIDPTTSPFITWNVNATTGDWIDINPDDGGYVTGFSESSTFSLIFKNTGMYRMDTVNKAVDPDNIFNVGAPSQEAIVTCQGVTYFFSGLDIRRTNVYNDNYGNAGGGPGSEEEKLSSFLNLYPRLHAISLASSA